MATCRDLRHTWTAIDFLRARRRHRKPRKLPPAPPAVAEIRHAALEAAILRARTGASS